MEAARLTTVLDAQTENLTRGLRAGASAGEVFARAMGASLAAVSAAAIKVGLVMDDAMDTIRIRTGQTGAALDRLGDSFKDVFRAGPDGAQQVSDALSTLRSRTGQTGDSLESLTTQVLTLSRITKTDLNSNVADSARLFTSWGIAASEQGNTLDLLFRTYQQTGVSIDALLGKMVTAGPTFRAAGFDFATSAALLGGFEQAGVSAERVISGMGRAFNFFSKEGTNASKGIRETIARIQELGPSAEAGALGVKVFGRGAVDMVAAIQSGRLNVEQLVSSIDNGTDTIEAAAKATDGFAENLVILRNRATLALEPFGTAILDTFNRGLMAVLEPSRGLSDALYRLGQAATLVAVSFGVHMVSGLVASTRAWVGNLIAAQAARVANVQSAAAGVRNAGAFLATARANFAATTAAANHARALAIQTGDAAALRIALQQLRSAHVNLAAAELAATGATRAHDLALQGLTLRARLAAGAVTALKGVLAFFGGPIGLAITVAMAAVSLGFLDVGRKARQAAANARQAAEDFRAALAGMNDAVLTATFVNAGATRSTVVDQIRSINALLTNQRQQVAALTAAGVRPVDPRLEVRGVASTTPAQRDLARYTASIAANERALASLRSMERRYGEQVSDASAELENRRRILRDMPSLEGAGAIGALDFEGSGAAAAVEAGRSVVDLLRERVDLLASVTESEQALGRVGTATQQALVVEYQRAEAMLRAMGDAAHLPDTALQGYRDLLDLVNRFRPETVRPTAGLQAALPNVDLGRTAAQVGAVNTRAASLFVAQQATRIERALKEGAEAAAARLKEATDNIRRAFVGWADSLPGVADARQGFSAARAGGAGVGASVAAGAGMAVAMEFLAGVAESLGPALEALLLPVRMLGETFGRALVPIARALFPTFRLVAIAASYVGETFFRVAGAINVAIGGLVRGIGNVLNALPGSLGNPLIALGQSMLDMGRGFQEGADELARARDELRGLTFDDALDRVNNGLNRLSESLSNVPPLFDLALRRMQAGRATAGAGSPAPSPAPPLPPTSGGGQGGQPVNVTYNVTVQVDGRAAATDREFLRFIKEGITKGLEGNDVKLQNAARAAVLGKR